MTDFKDTIIAELEVLRRTSLHNEKPEDVFKARVYAGAIKKIKALPHVRTPADAAGIGGAKVQEKILRIIETGSLNIAPEVRARAASSPMQIFSNIYGVGPAAAKKLIASGLTTMEGLRAAIADGTTTLNKNQLIGVRYYEALLERIPRAEMDAHAALLHSKLGGLEGTIVGSYRREKADSGDIDMLITGGGAAELRAFVDQLRTSGYIKEVLALGDHKCMAISALPEGTGRRLDLLMTPREQMPFAVMYFTGSDSYNVAMRKKANELGLTLNEHALTDMSTGAPVLIDRATGRPVIVLQGNMVMIEGSGRKPMGAATTSEGGNIDIIKTEEDLVSVLGLPYTAPRDR